MISINVEEDIFLQLTSDQQKVSSIVELMEKILKFIQDMEFVFSTRCIFKVQHQRFNVFNITISFHSIKFLESIKIN